MLFLYNETMTEVIKPPRSRAVPLLMIGIGVGLMVGYALGKTEPRPITLPLPARKPCKCEEAANEELARKIEEVMNNGKASGDNGSKASTDGVSDDDDGGSSQPPEEV